MTKVSIHSLELTPLECEVLSELMAAKLEQHIAERAKYVTGSGTGPTNPGATVEAGSPLPAETSSTSELGSKLGTANPAYPDEVCASPSVQKRGALSPLCPDCAWLAQDNDGPCATHRRACEGCGRKEGVALHDGEVSRSKLGPGEAPLVERWCGHCDPPPAVGLRFADSEADPWDLPQDELSTTCPLPRDERRGWSGDRAGYDPFDDRSDIQPFTRTGKP